MAVSDPGMHQPLWSGAVLYETAHFILIFRFKFGV